MADTLHSSRTIQQPIPSISTDDVKKRPRDKTNRVRDMAALLFAELFWKQCMADRKKTQEQADADKEFDSRPSQGL